MNVSDTFFDISGILRVFQFVEDLAWNLTLGLRVGA
jgi:hypothetical protein